MYAGRTGSFLFGKTAGIAAFNLCGSYYLRTPWYCRRVTHRHSLCCSKRYPQWWRGRHEADIGGKRRRQMRVLSQRWWLWMAMLTPPSPLWWFHPPCPRAPPSPPQVLIGVKNANMISNIIIIIEIQIDIVKRQSPIAVMSVAADWFSSCVVHCSTWLFHFFISKCRTVKLEYT